MVKLHNAWRLFKEFHDCGPVVEIEARNNSEGYLKFTKPGGASRWTIDLMAALLLFRQVRLTSVQYDGRKHEANVVDRVYGSELTH